MHLSTGARVDLAATTIVQLSTHIMSHRWPRHRVRAAPPHVQATPPVVPRTRSSRYIYLFFNVFKGKRSLTQTNNFTYRPFSVSIETIYSRRQFEHLPDQPFIHAERVEDELPAVSP